MRTDKARYIGASTMYAWYFERLQNIAEKHGWTKFVAMQNHYNLIYREEEREMIPVGQDRKIHSHPLEPTGGRAVGASVGNGNRTREDRRSFQVGVGRYQ